MSLELRIQNLLGEFAAFSDWEAKYKHLIEKGKALPPFPEELKVEDLKVKGCQSQVWIHARLTEDGRIRFQADSDALIVKGLVSVLLSVYSEATPEEILNTSPDFLEKLGFKSHLSPSRANGLFSMLKQIQYYATAFQVLLKKHR
jgi:cysteine desulfuration protein SufE